MNVAQLAAAPSPLLGAVPSDQNAVITQLSALRHAQGLSLKEVGSRFALTEETVADWERGAASPSLEALEQWAMSLGQRLALVPLAPEPSNGVRVDWETRHFTINGKAIRLTPMEWSIIERLAWTPGQLVTHRQLFKHLYGTDRECRAQSTAVRVRISKLRQKLPLTIEARWGQGYVIEGIEASRSPAGSEQRPATVGGEFAAARRESTAVEVRAKVDLMHRPATRESVMPAATMARRDVRPASRPAQMFRTSEPVLRSEALSLPPSHGGRAEELTEIERFLAERGVTKCPNAGAMELAPLPSLVWDKTKRKWVRPTS